MCLTLKPSNIQRSKFIPKGKLWIVCKHTEVQKGMCVYLHNTPFPQKRGNYIHSLNNVKTYKMAEHLCDGTSYCYVWGYAKVTCTQILSLQSVLSSKCNSKQRSRLQLRRNKKACYMRWIPA